MYYETQCVKKKIYLLHRVDTTVRTNIYQDQRLSVPLTVNDAWRKKSDIFNLINWNIVFAPISTKKMNACTKIRRRSKYA